MRNSNGFRSVLVLVLFLIAMYLLNGCSGDSNNLHEVNISQTRQVSIGDIHGTRFGGL